MTNDSPDPLNEWSRLVNENTIHEIVSAAYVGMLSRSPQIDSFSTWLLAGAGATASLLIANIESVTNSLTVNGFQSCLTILALSALFGLFTKCASVFFPIDGAGQSNLQKQVLEIFEKHGQIREKIEKSAELRDIAPPPGIEVKDIVTELLKPMPFYVKWVTLLYLKKHQENRQMAYLLPLRAFMWQANFCFLQALFFIAFIATTTLYAGSV